MIYPEIEKIAVEPNALIKALEELPDGLICEFGVAGGRTINMIAKHVKRTVYGFDSFQGLPEDWGKQATKGAFALPSGPTVKLDPNIEIIEGMFQDTLVPFLQQNQEPIAFVHMDCDLYSSTKYVLSTLAGHFAPNAVIAFDEIIGYQDFIDHEGRAFIEFLKETGYSWQCIGRQHQQGAIFRI